MRPTRPQAKVHDGVPPPLPAPDTLCLVSGGSADEPRARRREQLYDPVAYRLEPLLDARLRDLPPEHVSRFLLLIGFLPSVLLCLSLPLLLSLSLSSVLYVPPFSLSCIFIRLTSETNSSL